MGDSKPPGKATGGNRDLVGEQIQGLIGDLESAPPPDEDLSMSESAVPRTPWYSSWAVAAILLVVMIVMTVFNVVRHTARDRGPEPTLEEVQSMVEMTLLFAIEEIEAYRAEHEALPASLDALGLSEKGDFTYQRLLDGGYRLSATVSGERATFDSTVDDMGRFYEPALDVVGGDE